MAAPSSSSACRFFSSFSLFACVHGYEVVKHPASVWTYESGRAVGSTKPPPKYTRLIHPSKRAAPLFSQPSS